MGANNNRNDLLRRFPSITPPPAYTTIFNSKSINSNNNKKDWISKNAQSNVVTTFSQNNNVDGTYQYINGRQYMVIKGFDGARQLIPLRTPSATLFQYSYTQ